MKMRQVPCNYGPYVKDLSVLVMFNIEITFHFMAMWSVQTLWVGARTKCLNLRKTKYQFKTKMLPLVIYIKIQVNSKQFLAPTHSLTIMRHDLALEKTKWAQFLDSL